MTHDDLQAVAYCILRYFDACNKAGVTPSKAQAREAVRDIPEARFAKVMRSLSSSGYVTGVEVKRYYDGTLCVHFEDPDITLEGAEYLRENSGMRAARELAGSAFEAVVESLASALVRSGGM